ATAIAGYLTVCRLFCLRATSLAAIAVLVFFLAQPWLLYQATLIRTELYAVLFWHLALLAFVTALATQRRLPRLVLYTPAGTALGLAYLTKFQAFALVPIFFLLAKVGHDWIAAGDGHAVWAKRYGAGTIIANVAAVAGFAGMLALASRTEIGPQFFVI